MDELEYILEQQDVWLNHSRQQRTEELGQLGAQIQQLTRKIVALNNLDVIEACENEIYLLQQKQAGIKEKLEKAPEAIKKERLALGLRYFADPKKAWNEASNESKPKLVRFRFKEPLVLLRKENQVTNRSNSSIYHMFQRFKA